MESTTDTKLTLLPLWFSTAPSTSPKLLECLTSLLNLALPGENIVDEGVDGLATASDHAFSHIYEQITHAADSATAISKFRSKPTS